MKNFFVPLALIIIVASSFAEIRSPQQRGEYLDKAHESLMAQLENSRASGKLDAPGFDIELKKVTTRYRQMVVNELKDVVPGKIAPKDAFDWAKLYERADDHRTVCELASRYLASDPSPEQKYQAQLLIMRNGHALGDVALLKKTMDELAPASESEKSQAFQWSMSCLITIAQKDGYGESLKLWDRIRARQKLSNPLLQAKERLALEKTGRIPRSFDEPTLTNAQKLNIFETQAKNMNELVEGSSALVRAKLLVGEGRKGSGVAALDNFLSNHRKLNQYFREQIISERGQMVVLGSPATELKADRIIGNYVSIASLKGKVVLLDFTAHWCYFCMQSVPDLVSMYRAIYPQGLEIVAVTEFYGTFEKEKNLSREEEFSRLRSFFASKNITWPVVVGPKSNGIAYGVKGIPHVVLIDKKGIVREIVIGYTPETEERIRHRVEALLKE